MEMETLQDLLVEQLKDLYNAENQLVKALPKMAKAATDPELKQAFENHLEETKEHVARLETILGELDELGRGKKCKGREGLIEEGSELIEEDPEEDVLDAGLISKAQHVEHYEMAGYGTVRTWAQLMGHTEHARLLQTTLDEEGAADKLLTELAERSINIEANEEGMDEEEASAGRGSSSRSGSNGSSRSGGRSGTAKKSSGSRSRAKAGSR